MIILITIGIDLGLDYFKESKTTNRDYLIWDDITTIQFDKTTLAQALLISGITNGKEVPLQSALDPDWIMFIVYREQDSEDLSHTTSTPSGENANPANLWAKQSLIGIRDMEEPIRKSPEFNLYCWADQDAIIPDSPRTKLNPTFEDVKCSPAAFVSPLDMLYFFDMDPAMLETYSQD